MDNLDNKKIKNSNPNTRPNIGMVSLIAVLSTIIVILIAIILFLPNDNKQIMVSSKDSKTTEAYTSNQLSFEDIPIINHTYFLGKPVANTLTSANISSNTNEPITDSNNVNTNNTAVPIPEVSNSISNGEPHHVNTPSSASITKLINLNGENNNVTVNFTYGNVQDFNANSMYSISINGSQEKSSFSYSIDIILPDEKIPDNFCDIQKIANNDGKEYLLIYFHYDNSTYKTVACIFDENLVQIGQVEHDTLSDFTIDGKPAKFEITSNSIINYSWYNSGGVAKHIYTLEGSTFIDTLEKVYLEGEYEVAGRS